MEREKQHPNSFSTASILSLDAPPGLAIAFKASQYSFSTFIIIFPAVEADLRILPDPFDVSRGMPELVEEIAAVGDQSPGIGIIALHAGRQLREWSTQD
jgi:hypothetical protein